MEYTKPIWQINRELKAAGIKIYHDAMTGEECAEMFAKLDQNDPKIKEIIDRLQSATGNDRYYTMMDHLSFLGVEPPYRFYLEPNKNDSQEYVFDNGEKYSSCFYR